IFIFLNYHLSFDKGYENSDRIYRVVTSWSYPDGEFHSKGVPVVLAPALKQDFNQFENVASISSDDGILRTKSNGVNAEVKKIQTVYYAEPSFFEILKIKWLAGDPAKSLTQPLTIALSKKAAETYFGKWENAEGKTLQYDNDKVFTVRGVYEDFPQSSSFPLEVVMSYASFPDKNNKEWGWVASRQECYVLLKAGVKVEDLVAPMASFIKKYYVEEGPGKENHHFQPLQDLHYNSDLNNYAESSIQKSDIVGLMVIGIFLLVTACINFINLATAQAVSRSKEVGVRKVMGSTKQQLVIQFLSETTIITIVALLFACVLTELAIPSMESLFGKGILFSLFGHKEIYVFMLFLVLSVSFLAGLYPALIMSGFSPALAIKNKISSANAGGVGLRKTLVIVQFAITAILIIGTMVVMRQMEYMRAKSLGFDKNGIALIYMPTDSVSRLKYDIFREIVEKNPGVKSVSYSYAAPSSGSNNETNFSFNSSKDADFQVNVKPADADYFETFGLEMVAGTALSKSDTTKEYVVNETLIKKLNIADPTSVIGKMMTIHGNKAPIVGVVKDFNNVSLRQKIAPIAMFTSKQRYRMLAVKMASDQILPTMKFIEGEWNRLYPDYVYQSSFVEEQIKSYYESERVMGVMFKAFAGVVIFISFIGLFGLISFVATQRTREIAIRKVLGATTLELIKMLNSSFLWMVLIANLIAWPITFIFVNKWLA
ncbi:MAG: FtsX-like permease family protein, partial [Pedobacter sp.]